MSPFAHAVGSLSYSGRLVNTNGSPVSGKVHLSFDLAYSNNTNVILCTQTLSNVELTHGLFHVMLNFPDCNLTNIMSNIPDGNTVIIRVVDNTNGENKKYPFQSIHSIPFSFVSQMSKQLAQMSAADGQVLAWNGSQWAPKTLNTAISAGSVTEEMLQGNIPRSKLATGVADQIVVNDSSGNLSSLDGGAARALIGAMAFSDVEQCLSHQKLQMNPGPVFWSCVDDITEDVTKLPLTGGTLSGPLVLSGDPASALEATTKEYVDSAIEAIDPTVTGSVKFNPNAFQVELKANSATVEDLVFILPPAKGTAGQALVTDGNGNLSWAAPAAADSSAVGGDLSGTVANATIETGVVTSDKILDGTITNADIAALADIEQSKIKDFALTLSTKQDKIIGGVAGDYWDGSRSWIPLNTSKVPESTNLYFTDERARSALSVTSPLDYDNVTGVISFLDPGNSGNLLRSNGFYWESWTPDYLTLEEDDLQTVTDRGAMTTTFSEFSGGASFSKVGIGTNAPVGVLDIQSTSSGILIPRMTEGQRDLIASPSGMQIYNTTTNRIDFHDGTSWKALGVAGSGVQSITTGTGLVAATITDTGTVNVDVGTGAGKIPQLDGTGKLVPSVETDPTVQAFAKVALPSCGAGQVLKSFGTTFSCVADVDTFLVADGTSLITSGTTISVKTEGILDTNLKGISTSCSADQILLTNGLGAFYCGNRHWGEFAGGIFFNLGSVAIGGVAADSKAILDLQSTTKGFLPPRMTTAQRDGILTPTPGLMIYNNSTNTLQYFNNTKWIDLYGGTVVLDSGTISGTVTLSKTITIDQPAVVIFTSYMKGANYPMVTLQLNGAACGQDRSFNDIGNLYSSASCVKDLAVGTHTFRSIYGETSGSVNMDTHTMSWTVIAKNAGGSAAPVAGGGESFWGENGTDLYYTEGNIGLGTSIPDSRLSVNGDISLIGSLKVKSGTFHSELKGNPAASEDLLFILPPEKGTVGQTLVTDGAGNLSWATTTPADSSIEYSKLNLSDGDIPQSKVSGLSADLSSKEPLIPTGDNTQYIRGDKTLGTLTTSVIPEGTNKYFTEDKVLGTFLDGYLVGAVAPILFTDTLLGALGKLQAQISDAGKWSKNGTAIYYNNGNVGIGTNAPVSKLQITGGDLTFDMEKGIASTSGAKMFTGPAGHTWHAQSGDPIASIFIGKDSSGTTKFMFDAVGNLSVEGLVASNVGGFKFPDGTIQTTASGSPAAFMKKTMTAYQTVDSGTIVNFNTVYSGNGGLTASGNGINLKAGHTYRLEASLNTHLGDGNGYLGYTFYNGTTNFGHGAYTDEPDSNGSYGFHSGLLEFYTPSADTTVYVRIFDDNLGNGQVTPNYNTYFVVTEMVAGGISGASDNLGSHQAAQNLQLGSHWLSGDGGNEGIKINADGNVGVGASNPTSKLEVAGEIAGKSIKTRLFNAGGKGVGACTLSSANTLGTLDQFCELVINLTLTDPATVQINYSITMPPGEAGTAGSKHIVTGINIDNVLVTTTIAGVMTADPAYPSAVYWGPTQTHFAQLAAGAHTIKVVYRTPAGGESDPLAGEDWQDRKLQVLILGYQ